MLCHIVYNLKRMVEVVLVGASVACLHHVESREFGNDELQQSATLQLHESTTGLWGAHYLVEFVGNALAAHYLYAFGVASESLKRLVVDVEPQLGGEPYAAHHAQRIVREGDVGVERSAYYAVLKVVNAVEGVDQFAETVVIEAYSHSVDGEVAAVLVVFQGSVFDDRFARRAVIALASCAYKLHFGVVILHLRRAEVAIYSQMGAPSARLRVLSQFVLQCCCHIDTASHHHYINVVGGTFEENVAHISAYEIALYAQFVSHLAYAVKYVLVKDLCQFGICI